MSSHQPATHVMCNFMLALCSTPFACERFHALCAPSLNHLLRVQSQYYCLLVIWFECLVACADRKLALKLHPDKCTVRGADEAFKGVPCLSLRPFMLTARHSRHVFDMRFCLLRW